MTVLVRLDDEDVRDVVYLGKRHHDEATEAGYTNHPIGKRDPYHHHIDGKAGERAHERMTGIPMRTARGLDAGWDVTVAGYRIDIKTRDWQGDGIVFMVPTWQMERHEQTQGYGFFRRVGSTELMDLQKQLRGVTMEFFGYISRKRLVKLQLVTSKYGEEAYTCEPEHLVDAIG